MKKLLLDTNIYGEMVIDLNINKIKTKFLSQKDFIVYGIDLIRKELRGTSKRTRIGNKNLRIALLVIYDEIVKGHTFKVTEEMENVALSYYKAYREFGGSKSTEVVMNDFVIVACATLKDMDIVVSQDEKSMLTENAIRAYNLINGVIKRRTPNFINYEKFKRLLI